MHEARVADELEIRSLIARYSDAVARRDEKSWAATWAGDCEWHILGRPVEGRDAIVSLWSQMMGGFPFVLQLPTFGVVDFPDGGAGAGPDATGRWYVTEYGQGAGGSLLTLGVYHDRYLREDDAWRFARRRFDVLYMGPPDLSAAPLPFPSNP